MIKKRYLLILSVAIISVLFGSLLYNNLVLAGKPEPQPQVHKDAVEITALDWTARYYHPALSSEWGLIFYRYSYNTTDLPFVFSPKGKLLNVTGLWISVVAHREIGTGGGRNSFKAKINNNFTIAFSNVELSEYSLRSHTSSLEHDSVLNAIHTGVNLLQLYDLTETELYIYKISVFIEYGYEA